MPIPIKNSLRGSSPSWLLPHTAMCSVCLFPSVPSLAAFFCLYFIYCLPFRFSIVLLSLQASLFLSFFFLFIPSSFFFILLLSSSLWIVATNTLKRLKKTDTAMPNKGWQSPIDFTMNFKFSISNQRDTIRPVGNKNKERASDSLMNGEHHQFNKLNHSGRAVLKPSI